MLDRQRRVGGDPAGQRERRRDDLGGRHDVVDQAPLAGGGRVDRVAGEGELRRQLDRDLPLQADHSPGGGDQAALDLRQAEGSLLRGDDQVAGERDLGAAAHGVPVDRGDQGLADPVLGQAGEPPLRVGGRGDDAARGDLLEIGAGAEGPARAGDDDRPHLVVGRRALQVPAELVGQRRS